MIGKRRATSRMSLHHGLADLGLEVVQLGRVVPRRGRAVVAVVDVAGLVGRAVQAPEDDGRVAVVPVAVLQLDHHAGVGRQVRAGEAIAGVRRLVEPDEPLRMVQDPVAVEAHVVGHHVAGQADAVPVRALAQDVQRRVPAEVGRDDVAVDGVGGGRRVRVAHALLDLTGRPAPLPQADQPEPVDPFGGEGAKDLVGDLVERRDGSSIRSRQLLQPDVGVLGEQDDAGHPGGVGREPLGLVARAELGGVVASAAGVGVPLAQAARVRFLGQEVQRQRQTAAGLGGQLGRPVAADPQQLPGEGVR